MTNEKPKIKPSILESIFNGALSDPPHSKDVDFLKLPDGRVLKDAFIYHNYCQNQLNIDPQLIWKELNEIPTSRSNEPLSFDQTGSNPRWVKGAHTALNYRGNPINRKKIWTQDNYSNGMYKYGYTGWQNEISYAMCDVAHTPPIARLALKLNPILAEAGHPVHNHWIATIYDNEKDGIGFHSDKVQNFKPNTYFVVIKFGAERLFEFRMKNKPNDKPFYSETLKAGTAIFVRCNAEDNNDANAIVSHSVPTMSSKVGPSGSIVGRCIETQIPWDKVSKNITKAKKEKALRLSQKAAKNNPILFHKPRGKTEIKTTEKGTNVGPSLKIVPDVKSASPFSAIIRPFMSRKEAEIHNAALRNKNNPTID